MKEENIKEFLLNECEATGQRKDVSGILSLLDQIGKIDPERRKQLESFLRMVIDQVRSDERTRIGADIMESRIALVD